MQNICGKYEVFYNGSSVGNLSVSESGIKFLFECTCSLPGNTVFRLVCVSFNTPVSIGILIPQDSVLKLKKSFSKNELLSLGLKNITSCFITETSNDFLKIPPKKPEKSNFSEKLFWEPEHFPELLFTEEEITHVLTGVSGSLKLKYKGFIFLAIPLLPNEPFPAMPIFCFGETANIGGEEYIVFKIKNGKLC